MPRHYYVIATSANCISQDSAHVVHTHTGPRGRCPARARVTALPRPGLPSPGPVRCHGDTGVSGTHVVARVRATCMRTSALRAGVGRSAGHFAPGPGAAALQTCNACKEGSESRMDSTGWGGGGAAHVPPPARHALGSLCRGGGPQPCGSVTHAREA
jgi:hypothetical protein